MAYVQQNGTYEGTTQNVTLTLSTLPTVGNTMILNIEAGNGYVASSITDSVNTWTLAKSQTNSTMSTGSQWYCQVATGYTSGATITINTNGSAAKQVEVDEFSGFLQPVTLDGTDSKATTSSVLTLATTTGLTTTRATDLVVGAIYPGTNQASGASSFTAPTNFTVLPETVAFYRLQVAYYYPGTTLSAKTFTWSWTTSSNASMIFVAYEQVTSGTYVKQTASGYTFLNNSVATPSMTSGTFSTGDSIVALISAGTNSADVTSVTDTLGNTYTKVYQYDDPSSGGMDLECWIAPVTTGGSSNIVTAHDVGANLFWISVYHVSGLYTSAWLDQSTYSNQDTSGTAISTTFGSATTNTPDLLLQANVAIGLSATNLFSLTTGWSYMNTAYDYTDGGALGFAFGSQAQVVSSTGTFATTMGFSGTATNSYHAIMVALKGGTPAPTGNTSNFLAFM
jgi:hypothetical protein